MQNLSNQAKQPEQMITITNRKKIEISAVSEVLSAQDNCVVLKTDLGPLLVYGQGLRIDTLSLEQKKLIVDGNINGIKYDGQIGKKNFFARIFK